MKWKKMKKKRDKKIYSLLALCSFVLSSFYIYSIHNNHGTENTDTLNQEFIEISKNNPIENKAVSDNAENKLKPRVCEAEKDDDIEIEGDLDTKTCIACDHQEVFQGDLDGNTQQTSAQQVCKEDLDNNTQPANAQQVQNNDQLYLIDKIVAKIDDTIITHSDVVRPGIDGATHTLKELEDEAHIYNKAKSYNMTFTQEAIERDLKKLAEDQGFSYAELKNIFESSGCTEEEGRDKFAKMKSVNQLVSYKVMSRCVVPERDLIVYYDEHPETVTARYYLRNAIIPYDANISKQEKKNLEKKIIAAVNSNDDLSFIKWGNPHWYEQGEIDENQVFVYDLEEGEISAPYDTQRCFLIYELLEKEEEHLVALEDRREKINEILWKERYAKLMGEFMDDLRKNSFVAYL